MVNVSHNCGEIGERNGRRDGNSCMRLAVWCVIGKSVCFSSVKVAMSELSLCDSISYIK